MQQLPVPPFELLKRPQALLLLWTGQRADGGFVLLRVPGEAMCRERRLGRLLGRVFALSLGFKRLA